MLNHKRLVADICVVVMGSIFLLLGIVLKSVFLLLLGLTGIGYFGFRTWIGYRTRRHVAATNDHDKGNNQTDEATSPPQKPKNVDDTGDLVEQMLEQGRYALLLRQQIADNLLPTQLRQAQSALDETMGLVPQGDVTLAPPLQEDEEIDVDSSREIIRVEGLFLDRYPVTNTDYQMFIMMGGYEQMELWAPEIWPAVINFVDTTRYPGPRFWSNRTYPKGIGDHPVVGVSWYEAAAYARWTGKRLPFDPEWVKAAAWPVSVPGAVPLQKRFPWGDSFNPKRANLWASGKHTTNTVYEFSDGVNPSGIHGLIGNVWEWTNTNYGMWDNRRFEMSTPFMSLRGGAFDSYFENQATSQFQSGDVPVARKHNIGFRCAVGLCDIVSWLSATETEKDSDAELDLTTAT